ncbi:MAG: 23S rRNA (uracil(1939)-C(5))-methyltransferase RlmD [Oscillospiraceae bacterium]
MPLHKNQLIPLTITALSSDGNGVGRHEGQVVFVPHAAVGDVLSVRVVKPAKRLAYGKIEQVVTPGPGRVPPDCPASTQCGGCSFRHLSYAAELAAKQSFVQDALVRIGQLDVPVLPPIPSPLQNRYRNKVQYPVTTDAQGRLAYGFFAPRSHRVVPCCGCLLQPAHLNQIAARLAALLGQAGALPYNEATHKGQVRHLYLRQSTHSGEVFVCVVATRLPLPGADALVEELTAAFPQVSTVLVNLNAKPTNVICGPESVSLFGPGFIHDTLAGVPVRLGPHSFFQVNAPAAEQLFAIVQTLADPMPNTTLLDLYCGTGVIGLSMAARCKTLLGVDTSAEAIENARWSAEEMGLSNTRFLCADAGSAAARFAFEGLRPDVITVDPPRKGLDEATRRAMLAMAPGRIVMVSCNPATLARDLAVFHQSGYSIRPVQPIDLFPRTRHVECVVLLQRRDEVSFTKG